ncbi:hypothetical protein ASD14_01885 [Lysobacter sp. Root494]|nr:hypothetical protein ASD14_01885 [Lysobacter sp. Root494]
MKCVKQDRYVSRRGPFDQWPAGCADRALGAAENEGWPLAARACDAFIPSRLASPTQEPLATPG